MAKNRNKKKSWWRKLLKLIFVLILIVVLAAAGLFGYLTLTEYKPDARETVAAEGTSSGTLAPGDSFTIMTWNIGYGALGDNADFFMDGGTMVQTADLARVSENMKQIIHTFEELTPDVVFFQEVDRNSSRSHGVDEALEILHSSSGYQSAFAHNYVSAFVPYPWPPIGKVEGGILTLSAYHIDSAERIQLPCPFSWPLRLGNLKRCLLVSRTKLEGTDQELVLVNLHLEAYDSGEGKIEQTKMLKTLLDEEAAKGNYVIAGGDFNQLFSNTDASMYPVAPDTWQPGIIDIADFGEDWQCVMDNAHPTCRSLDKPYAGADHDNFQYYMIDGFIVSSNLAIRSVHTQDLGFVNSDHNPVLMEIIIPEDE